MTKPDLKPCPFCGGEAKIHRDMGIPGGPDRFEIRCTDCGCSSCSIIGGTETITKTWNTRISPYAFRLSASDTTIDFIDCTVKVTP